MASGDNLVVVAHVVAVAPDIAVSELVVVAGHDGRVIDAVTDGGGAVTGGQG
jgi:hypothetical protein